MKSFFKAALLAVAVAAMPIVAEAGPSGGHGGGGAHWGGGGGHWHGGAHWHGGYWGYGGWYGGYWGYPGYWAPAPYYYYGGAGTVVYADGLYGSYPYYPSYNAPPVVQYGVAEPRPGDQVVRSGGQPVPPAAPQAEPIFYPRNGQTLERFQADRDACNQWAASQRGAANDASVFQRATFACMDGRGYTGR
jgi:hypothetical protein